MPHEPLTDEQYSRIHRLFQSLIAREHAEALTNADLADRLMDQVWADMEITSPQSILVEEAIERLRKGQS